jgi:prevent-host-death family protein
MLDMIKTNIRQLQHHLSEVMRYVEHGEEVLITRRNRVVAKLIPAEPQVKQVDWPDFVGRAKAIVKKPKGKPASRVVVEDREERI